MLFGLCGIWWLVLGLLGAVVAGWAFCRSRGQHAKVVAPLVEPVEEDVPVKKTTQVKTTRVKTTRVKTTVVDGEESEYATCDEESEDEPAWVAVGAPPPLDGSNPYCPHLRLSKLGSNQYMARLTCKDCSQVVERVKRRLRAP